MTIEQVSPEIRTKISKMSKALLQKRFDNGAFESEEEQVAAQYYLDKRAGKIQQPTQEQPVEEVIDTPTEQPAETPKEPKAPKTPKAPKEPKAPKAPKQPKVKEVKVAFVVDDVPFESKSHYVKHLIEKDNDIKFKDANAALVAAGSNIMYYSEFSRCKAAVLDK